MADVMRWYNTVNAALLDHLTNQIKETDNSGVWRYAFTHFLFFEDFLFYLSQSMHVYFVVVSIDSW